MSRAVQPRESTSVSRRGICDRAIWRKWSSSLYWWIWTPQPHVKNPAL